MSVKSWCINMSKTVKRVLWFVTVFVLVILLGLAISENHALKKELKEEQAWTRQLEFEKTNLIDRNWNL